AGRAVLIAICLVAPVAPSPVQPLPSRSSAMCMHIEPPFRNFTTRQPSLSGGLQQPTAMPLIGTFRAPVASSGSGGVVSVMLAHGETGLARMTTLLVGGLGSAGGGGVGGGGCGEEGGVRGGGGQL